MKLKIAITGANGFIGSWIIKKLKKKYTLIGIVRNLGKINPELGIEFKESDYSLESLKEAVSNCDCVFHLAAARPKTSSKYESFKEYNENLIITTNLFDACRENNIKDIVIASSRSVYSPEHNEKPFKVCQKIENSLNLYGVSKYFCEKLALNYNEKFSMDIKSLRLGQVLGFGEKEGVMVTNFVKKANAKEPLTLYGNGIGRRHYVYVKDVVSAFEKAMSSDSKEKIFNIAMEKNYSHKEFAETVNFVFGNYGNIKYLKDKKEDEREYLLDIRETKLKLNWIPEYDLKSALMDMKKNL